MDKTMSMDHNNHNNKHSEHISHNHLEHHKIMAEDFKKRFAVSLIVTLPILALSPLLQQLIGVNITLSSSKYILWVLSSFIYFYGGWPFFKGAYGELKSKQPGMMLLIALAISVAYIYSAAVVFALKGKYFFWELATLIDIMLVGHYIEMRSVISASKALEMLAKLLPKTAHLKINNKIVDIDIAKLNKGNTVLVKAGEKIPADGTIIKGEAYIDESMITGESKPVKKSVKDNVIGGSTNGDGTLELIVEQAGKESYINKVIELVREAQSSKSKTQRIADVAAKWLTIIAISAGSITFLYWYFFGPSLEFAIERMATVMIITCPHALGLAIPLVSAVSTSIAAKNGLLIRNRTAFENSKNIDIVAFDKTGTLTKGNFVVSSIVTFDKRYTKEKIIQYASSLEQSSEHPIAKGIINKLKQIKGSLFNVDKFNVLKGEGVEGIIDGIKISLVSKQYLKKHNIEVNFDDTYQGTFAFLLENNKPIGLIVLSDEIREESKRAIETLHNMGIKCWMITGDNKAIAEYVSRTLNIDGYFAEVLPHEKLIKIKQLQQNNNFVAMTGDGINDAPALAQADIGIAIGSGTDVAIETADVILTNSSPQDVVSLILLGRATYNKIIQNLLWAVGYNIVAIPLAAGVLYDAGILISPAIGAALMSVSTVIVAINAKLLKIKKLF